jgi:hypothetical protein
MKRTKTKIKLEKLDDLASSIIFYTQGDRKYFTEKHLEGYRFKAGANFQTLIDLGFRARKHGGFKFEREVSYVRAELEQYIEPLRVRDRWFFPWNS